MELYHLAVIYSLNNNWLHYKAVFPIFHFYFIFHYLESHHQFYFIFHQISKLHSCFNTSVFLQKVRNCMIFVVQNIFYIFSFLKLLSKFNVFSSPFFFFFLLNFVSFIFSSAATSLLAKLCSKKNIFLTSAT